MASLLQGSLDVDTFSETVQREFPDADFETLSSPEIDDSGLPLEQNLVWSANRQGYTLVIEGQTATSIIIGYEGTRRPSVERMVECLGPPEQYWAWYGPSGVAGNKLAILLLYPSRGIAVDAASFEPYARSSGVVTDHLPFDPRMPASALVYTSPMSTVEIVGRVRHWVPNMRNLAVERWYVENLKPWPGSWEQIEVMTEPFPEGE